ncbi:MAG: hypothetical protein HZA15_02610 [Nitrospirae bacterium]|nr:hypothetical protein [Nitrospirota bacterium]
MQPETVQNKAEGSKSSPIKRFAELSVGLLTNKAIDSIFNYLIYPFVIYNFGILRGGVVMTFLSFITCLGVMRFYDWSGRDWLGIEAIKDLKDYKGKKNIGRFTSWFLKKSDTVAFLFLSIWYDPFIVTAYLRNGKFNGMNRRDWTIFMSSLILSNAYWTLAVYMGISLVEWVWKALAG